MKEQARLARNKYYREYRARNPDKVREANRRYWQKKAEQEARHVTENADNS
ncbi:MAG: phosphatase [Oscillospiraceae bacterium]|nr:phosphatase [Oscillospiraceae bacterium]